MNNKNSQHWHLVLLVPAYVYKIIVSLHSTHWILLILRTKLKIQNMQTNKQTNMSPPKNLESSLWVQITAMLEWYNGKLLLADTLSCVNITLDHIVYKYEKNMQNLLSIWLWFHIFHFVVFAMPVLTALCTVYALSADIFVAYDTWWISFFLQLPTHWSRI